MLLRDIETCTNHVKHTKTIHDCWLNFQLTFDQIQKGSTELSSQPNINFLKIWAPIIMKTDFTRLNLKRRSQL